jgi:hypothetical protein
VAKGFVNLNRFKHGRAIKRNSKQKADLQIKRKSEAMKAKSHDKM